jgi:N-acetylglucosamine-6-sulfatase
MTFCDRFLGSDLSQMTRVVPPRYSRHVTRSGQIGSLGSPPATEGCFDRGMSRRLGVVRGQVLVVFAALFAALPLSLHVAGSPAAGTAAPAVDTRPNIVFISSDDQRADDMWVMDHVNQRIAAQGTTFARSYANFPLCCPARATFQTGQYAHNHGVLGNLSSTSPLGGYPAFDTSSTIGTWLKAGGYRTAFVGKYLNKYGSVKPITVPPGWDDWHAIVGGGNYFDTRLFENGTTHRYTGPYQTDLLGNIATNIINREAPKSTPFLLYASFFPPHSGAPTEPDDPEIATPAVAPEWKDHYAGLALPVGGAYNEADVSDKPSFVRSRHLIGANLKAQLTESNQQRLESLESLDAAIDHMLDALQNAGELTNTVIIYTSDNGYMRGEHRLHAGKTVVYEPSTRVPLIVQGPGFPAGVTRNQLAGHIDIAPTIARAAGVTPGLTIDGVPLQDLAASDTAWAARPQVLEAGPQTVDGPWFYRAVRTPRWLYVDYDTEDFLELYDMNADPNQMTNLAYNPSYATQRSDMATLLSRLRSCAGANCRS